MTTYSDKGFDSSHYDSARPNYPERFYESLVAYHDSKNYPNSRDFAIDLGCGTGFATFKLLEYFQKVTGTDTSNVMISQCLSDQRTSVFNGRIEFAQGSGEEQPSSIASNSADMITAAECSHWFDHGRFFKESHRVLKPKGTLAYWLYKDPIFVDFPVANEIYDRFTYQSSLKMGLNPPGCNFERFMGPYYQQPGHNFLKSLLEEIAVPDDLYENVTRHVYDPTLDSDDASKTPLYISKTIDLKGFLAYVKSWSAYHNWMKEHGDKYDVAEEFVAELSSSMGIDDSHKFKVVWATVYVFCTKK